MVREVGLGALGREHPPLHCGGLDDDGVEPYALAPASTVEDRAFDEVLCIDPLRHLGIEKTHSILSTNCGESLGGILSIPPSFREDGRQRLLRPLRRVLRKNFARRFNLYCYTRVRQGLKNMLKHCPRPFRACWQGEDAPAARGVGRPVHWLEVGALRLLQVRYTREHHLMPQLQGLLALTLLTTWAAMRLYALQSQPTQPRSLAQLSKANMVSLR